jgi:hypothetical protein
MAMNPRLLRPLATGFNPRSIADLAAWWDFNDTATVTIATGISAVTDKSGNGRTLEQTTTNNQPAWTASVINGKYAAVFNGTSHRLRASFALSQPLTIFAVGRYNGVNAASNATMLDGFAGGNRARVFWSNAASTAALAINAGAQITLPAGPPSGNALAFGVHEAVFNGSSSFYGWSGSPTNTGNAGTAVPDGITLGAFGTGTLAFGEVDIATVLLYSRALSADERGRIRRWLGGLYALTVV